MPMKLGILFQRTFSLNLAIGMMPFFGKFFSNIDEIIYTTFTTRVLDRNSVEILKLIRNSNPKLNRSNFVARKFD